MENEVLKESVETDTFEKSSEIYHNQNDEESNCKYRPLNLDYKDIESIIDWPFYRKNEFKNGNYE